MKNSKKQVIGRRVKVTILRLGIKGVFAKVDSGAFRSAIHCSSVREVSKDGKKYLKVVFDKHDKLHSTQPVILEKYHKVKVRNTSGIDQIRFAVITPVIIKGKNLETIFTFADRQAMTWPILLGRKVLKGNFVIDVDYGIMPDEEF